MSENSNDRLEQLTSVLEYDSQLKENGQSGHFSVIERILINQERGKLLAGKENHCHPIALRKKIEFVIAKLGIQ